MTSMSSMVTRKTGVDMRIYILVVEVDWETTNIFGVYKNRQEAFDSALKHGLVDWYIDEKELML